MPGRLAVVLVADLALVVVDQVVVVGREAAEGGTAHVPFDVAVGEIEDEGDGEGVRDRQLRPNGGAYLPAGNVARVEVFAVGGLNPDAFSNRFEFFRTSPK